MRTRYWSNDEGNNGIQFRTDVEPMIWFCTNLGWMGIDNAPKDVNEAEKVAEEMAKNYGYKETSQEFALYMAGFDNEGD